MLFLVEAMKCPDSEFEPIDVVIADDAQSATIEANITHARTTHCRWVREWTGSINDIEYLAKKGLKICQGEGWCAIGSSRQHLAKISEDDVMGITPILDELRWK